jgi:hypothetical protein
MMKAAQLPWKVLVCAFALVLTGCGNDLWVTAKDFNTLNGSGPIKVFVTFNKAVDPSTVTPGSSLILAGGQDLNAAGNLAWSSPTQLTFTTVKNWGQIVSTGGTDTGFTLILKSTIRAKDGNVLDQCKTGKPGTEGPGDCVLAFVIPG